MGTNQASASTDIFATVGPAFSARSFLGSGLRGQSDSNVGTYGKSISNTGAYGFSTSFIGVYGYSLANNYPGAVGHSYGNNTGVQGHSGTGAAPAAPAKTGVFGSAVQDANSRGVHGKSTAGRGVYGEATSGLGVRGYATTGVAGSFGTVGLRASSPVAQVASP